MQIILWVQDPPQVGSASKVVIADEFVAKEAQEIVVGT